MSQRTTALAKLLAECQMDAQLDKAYAFHGQSDLCANLTFTFPSAQSASIVIDTTDASKVDWTVCNIIRHLDVRAHLFVIDEQVSPAEQVSGATTQWSSASMMNASTKEKWSLKSNTQDGTITLKFYTILSTPLTDVDRLQKLSDLMTLTVSWTLVPWLAEDCTPEWAQSDVSKLMNLSGTRTIIDGNPPPDWPTYRAVDQALSIASDIREEMIEPRPHIYAGPQTVKPVRKTLRRTCPIIAPFAIQSRFVGAKKCDEMLLAITITQLKFPEIAKGPWKLSIKNVTIRHTRFRILPFEPARQSDKIELNGANDSWSTVYRVLNLNLDANGVFKPEKDPLHVNVCADLYESSQGDSSSSISLDQHVYPDYAEAPMKTSEHGIMVHYDQVTLIIKPSTTCTISLTFVNNTQEDRVFMIEFPAAPKSAWEKYSLSPMDPVHNLPRVASQKRVNINVDFAVNSRADDRKPHFVPPVHVTSWPCDLEGNRILGGDEAMIIKVQLEDVYSVHVQSTNHREQ